MLQLTGNFTDDSFVVFLYDRPIGHITRLGRPSARLYSRPSVCPVRDRNSKTKEHRKIKIDIDDPHCTSKWSAYFQFERSKVKVTGRKTSKI